MFFGRYKCNKYELCVLCVKIDLNLNPQTTVEYFTVYLLLEPYTAVPV